MIFLVISMSLLTTITAQYICVDPYGAQYNSPTPCSNNNNAMCTNGGRKLFIGCYIDTTCALYTPGAVCVSGCCCTSPNYPVVPPITAAPIVPTQPFFDAAPSASLSLLVVVLLSFHVMLWR